MRIELFYLLSAQLNQTPIKSQFSPTRAHFNECVNMPTYAHGLRQLCIEFESSTKRPPTMGSLSLFNISSLARSVMPLQSVVYVHTGIRSHCLSLSISLTLGARRKRESEDEAIVLYRVSQNSSPRTFRAKRTRESPERRFFRDFSLVRKE